ncbi:MAG: arsenosugar biosynthesis radical SAM (seleno)protein ArsS [Nitrospinota bacterium]
MASTFGERLARAGFSLRRARVETLQVNVGKLCNQTCRHCHVDAGPHRTEVMTRATMERALAFLEGSAIPQVDITGGAPEMNPDFAFLVEAIRALGRHVMVRCNLTVLFVPGKGWLPEFYRRHGAELICSLPCYLGENVDRQRGRGVFEKSVEALRLLNGLGYGLPGSPLQLHLVYNPIGAYLPPPQAQLEADYRRELKARFAIQFHRLYTLTNMPIHRFATQLRREGAFESYMALLRESFNPETVPLVMCRTLLSVGWAGTIYDCDFNQMLEMAISNGRPLKLWEVDPKALEGAPIRVGEHCFGCTAGAGSSCGGALR